MRKISIQAILFTAILIFGSSEANAQVKREFIGKWTFETPSAPDGYTMGFIDIKKDSVIMEFTGNSTDYPSNWVKFRNDSLIYESDINGTTVRASLKIVDGKTISGEAVWSDGQTAMTLKKKNE
jgi:hypothetical protein